MSSSDPGNLFATQRWAADQRMIGTQAQVGAMQSIGNTAQDTVRYLQELSMRKQELDYKAQAFQVEQAMNMEKLRQMQAIDMTTQSRLQIEGMKAQNKLMEAQAKGANDEVEQRARGYAALSPSEQSSADYVATLERTGLGPALREARIIIGENGEMRKPKSQQEALEFKRKFAEAGQTQRVDTDWHYAGIRAKNLQEQLKSIDDELETLKYTAEGKTAEGKTRIEGLRKRKAEIEAKMGDIDKQLEGAGPKGQQMDPDVQAIIDWANK
jgi:hypothetical protein